MNAVLVKGIVGAIGLGGAVVGGYYAVETLTDERVPLKNTIERQLRKQGYTILSLNEEKWQEKFDLFKENEKLSTFPIALKEGKDTNFKVAKGESNSEGGKALENWCKEVLELEKDTGHKTIENAKLFCAEQKPPKPESKQD